MLGNRTPVWRLFKVDRSTWESLDEIGGLVSASVDRELDADGIMSGTLRIEGMPPSGYVRLVCEMYTDDGASRHEAATFWAMSSGRTIHLFQSVTECECASVLRPAQTKLLDPGWSFPSNADPVEGALQLLGTCIDAPVTTAASDFRTTEAVIAEDGETALTMARHLLGLAKWHIDMDGHGNVTAVADGTGTEHRIDMAYNDVVTGDVTDTLDLFDVPNVVLATDGNGNWVEARNDDELSDTSTQSIGFEVGRYESFSLQEGETLLGKAYDLLDELSGAARTIEYTCDWEPSRHEGSPVRIHLPALDIDGLFIVQSQSLDVSSDASSTLASETATLYVDTFNR